MHELSIAQSIIERVEAIRAEHEASGIASVQLQVGTLSGVDPYALELAFSVAVERTLYADTRWDIESVVARVKCRTCGRTTAPDGPFPICMNCDSTDIAIVTGRELMIDTIEVKQDEEKNHV
ncbi:MAG: hydrogenase maturation nickel metallochaperone HypA [Verrucomicrobia bacterium]|jgi:hydrogenase nickel incorporation protein HypA/HybF|nr:hydrogenase maturation nickel metallochaperone HypA [Verrucomicrobiota bacterium]MBT7069063.1 hydrogenase maturation nickel metallochaperone HypA [Verrucomicrobiota bacterium]MBT7701260.1 hydrogenase maturation nickel metallochaperone HypA [Verrucomicrobiota bacterium]